MELMRFTEQVDSQLRPLLVLVERNPEDHLTLEKAVKETGLLHNRLMALAHELARQRLMTRYEIEPRQSGKKPRRSGPAVKKPRPIIVGG